MILVDTSVWIDYFTGRVNLHTDWLDGAIGREDIGLTDLILCELLQGVRDDASFRRMRSDLEEFRVEENGGHAMAIRSAQNYRLLRSRGITVRKTVDCLIATFCIRHGHALLHRDSDFEGFEKHLGLRVYRPVSH